MTYPIVLFGYLILATLITYGTGWAILFFSRNQNFSQDGTFGKISLSLLTGFLTISSCTALFATKGLSLSWLVLLPLTFFLYNTSSDNKTKLNKIESIPLGTFALLLGISFLIIWIFNGSPTSLLNLSVHDDYYFYAKNAGSLISQGLETTNALHMENIAVEKGDIYHFGNLWFCAFFLQIFNCSEIEFLLFVSYPLLITTCFIGCLQFFKPKNQRWTIISIITILLLFFGGTLQFNSKDPMLYAANLWYSELFGLSPTTVKMTPVLAAAPLILHFVLNRKILNLACFTLILSGIYITVLPGLVGIFLGTIVWTYFIDSNYSKKSFLRTTLKSGLILIIGFTCLLIYQKLAIKITAIKPWFEITKPEAIIWSFKYFTYPFIIFLGLIPGIIWAIVKKSQQLGLIIFVVCFGLIASICFVMLNIFQQDINQVIINFMMVFGPIILVFFISKIRKFKIAFTIFLVVVSLNAIHKFSRLNIADRYPVKTSKSFQKEVILNLQQSNWILARNEVPWKWFFIFDNPTKFILNQAGTIYPIDVTAVIQQKGRFPFKRSTFDLKAFTKEKNIQFVFAEDTARLPKELQLELVTKDKNTGFRFYKINP